MGDEQKRDPRQFEPPPWERDAFEALARKKAEEQDALNILALTQVASGAPDTSIADVLIAEAMAAKSGGASPANAVAVAGGADVSVGTRPAVAVVDEHRVKAMLMELSKEEKADTGHIQLIARIASVITAAVGAGMLVGGLMTLAGSSQDAAKRTITTTMASGALSVFGLCFMAIAAWVWVRSNHVKGSR
jgi:hypothetical protein